MRKSKEQLNLEAKIYQEYDRTCPTGETRIELSIAINEAKTFEDLEIILDDVQNGGY